MLRRKWWQVSLSMLFVVVTAFALLFGWTQPERPPPPMVPKTDGERQILKLANEFVAMRGPKDYVVPVRIVSSPKNDGTVAVIFWTPRREFRLLGNRSLIVDPESGHVELVMRD